MRPTEVLQAWSRILAGCVPSMSIEITRECPLRCPGCYAYEEAHLGGGVTLRQLFDYKGAELVEAVLRVVDCERPLHLSLVGGDPLVRFRELEVLLPQLLARGIFVQVVTSAFRAIPPSWATFRRFNLAVSVDGLPEEHDKRRTPATYERILKNIAGHRVIIHCTITAQMMGRPDYLERFLQFWSARPETRKIWMSIFTPQRGANPPESLSPEQRTRAVLDLLRLRKVYPKLDMGERTLREFLAPPRSPEECIFARTTLTLSADLTTKITPCQFGGDPDCSRCGCLASMGLAAVGNYRIAGVFPVRRILAASERIGELVASFRPRSSGPEPSSKQDRSADTVSVSGITTIS